jgi:hypothetical protein
VWWEKFNIFFFFFFFHQHNGTQWWLIDLFGLLIIVVGRTWYEWPMAMIIWLTYLVEMLGLVKLLLLESSFKQTTSKVGPFC